MGRFKKVVVGISGGVDSAVTGLLLKLKGFNVHGVFMTNWDVVDEGAQCSITQDKEDARYVCTKLGISFHEVTFVKQYWTEVFTYLMDEYQAGNTPNPDIMCNKNIKFNLFFKYATEQLNADALATGHYAGSSFGAYLDKFSPDTNVKLLKAKDKFKDQTFFLSQVPQQGLRRTMFPLGDLTKPEVKQIALKYGLDRIVKKKESTGVCFIGLRNFKQFISEYVDARPGNFIDITTGRVVGSHQGIHLYTIGERCRITTSQISYHVAFKNSLTGDIYVAPGTYHPVLYSDILYTSPPYWIADSFDHLDVLDCQFRFQHTKPLINCKLVNLRLEQRFVSLEKPVKALTPGQYAVFYKNNVCLGSAKILSPGPSYHSLGKAIEHGYNEYLFE